MDFKAPEITDQDLDLYYFPVPREIRSPFPTWREYFENWVRFHHQSLNTFLLYDSEERRKETALHYLRDTLGFDVFNWIYKVGQQPVFGEAVGRAEILCNNGKALLHYRELRAAQREGRTNPSSPPMYIGSTGAQGMAPPAPGDNFTVRLGLYVRHFERIGTYGGTQWDYARILPMTYFARGVLDAVCEADKEEKFKPIWDDLPTPAEPLGFWDATNQKFIALRRAVKPKGETHTKVDAGSIILFGHDFETYCKKNRLNSKERDDERTAIRRQCEREVKRLMGLNPSPIEKVESGARASYRFRNAAAGPASQ